MIVCIVLVVVRITVAGSSTVDINADAPSGTLLSAFQDPAVTDIFFKADYHVDNEFEAYSGVKASLPVTRNVTLRGSPGQQLLLDLNYQSAVLEICSSCTFNIRDLALGRERRGTGVIVDFFVGQPGSVLLLNNTARIRPACTSRKDSQELTQNTPRSPRFLGPTARSDQQITAAVNATYDGVEYPDSLLIANAAMDVPLAFQELRGLQGGFTIVIHNTLRLCAHYVSDDCLMIKSPEACVNEMIDSLLNANKAEGSGGGASSSSMAAVVVPVVVAVVVLAAAAAAAAFFVLWKRRRHRKPDNLTNLLPVKGGGGGAAGGKDLEAGNTATARGLSTDQGATTDHHHDHSPDATNKGWIVTSSCTAPFIGPVPDDERIQFGVLVGAGSFGKVYKGSWAGRDVAIKVIEHDKSTAAAVENEVMLMLSFDHPNIVQAYHYVTFALSSSTSNALLAHGACATTGDTTASSSGSNINFIRSFKAAESCSSGAAAGMVRSRSLLSNSSSQPALPAAAAAAAAAERRCFRTQEAAQAAAAHSTSTLLTQQQQQQQEQQSGDVTRSQYSDQVQMADLLARVPSPLPGRGCQQQQQLQQGHTSDRPDTPIGHLTALNGAADHHHHHQQQQHTLSQQQQHTLSQQQQQQQTSHGEGVSILPAAACSSGQQQQQRLGLAEAGAAVRPGSPLPGCHPSNADEFADANEWVVQGAPFSERIDTSRWPGIMDYMSANTGYSSKENARAKTWLVLEYCDLGTLSHIASEWGPDQEDEAQMLQRLVLLQDTARGLQALHAKNVVHGDLNARNVLVSSSPTAQCGMEAKLADLGLSRVVKQHKTHRTTNTVGTMSHMPPELLRYGRMSPAVDVFAFGVMMWEVFTGEVAFRTLHYGQFFEMVVLRNQRPPVPSTMPEDYQLLMERCWSASPADRPSADLLLQCIALMIRDRQQAISVRSSLSNHSWSLEAAAVRDVMQHTTGRPLQQQQQQQQQQEDNQSTRDSLHSSRQLKCGQAAGPVDGDDQVISIDFPPQSASQTAANGQAGVAASSSSSSRTACHQAAHSGRAATMAAAADAARPRQASTGNMNKTSVTVVMTDLQAVDTPQQQQPRRMSLQQQQTQQQSSMQQQQQQQQWRRMSLQPQPQQQSSKQQQLQSRVQQQHRCMSLQQPQQQGSMQQYHHHHQQQQQQRCVHQRRMSLQQQQTQQQSSKQQQQLQRRMSLQECTLEASEFIDSW